MKTVETDHTVGSSFRDPSGFLFHRNGQLLRQVNLSYAEHYSHLMESGLYEALTERSLIVAHEETSETPAEAELCFKIVRPEVVPFISYPY